ncbi:MAG: hypothetical protein MJ161_05895 [Clostridia bacterium]|nr:hypothetical protein [Clostridia bacterium]
MLNEKNRMFVIYMARLVARILIFLAAVAMYIFHKEWFTIIVSEKFFLNFTPLHVHWIILMLGMVIHLLPKFKITMSGLKSRPYTYREPEEGYDKLQLLEYVQQMNIRAWRVLLLWVCGNAVFGILYLAGVIGAEELVMLTIFYFTCDLICMLVFCPFQKYMMGNRCCVNCRIFDWGHMMMYTPMLFIPSFFSWSLLFTSLVVAIRWELTYSRYPERFWRGSNATIRCENCKDKTCRIKKPVVWGIDKVASAMPAPANKIAASAEELDSEFED